MLVIKVCGFIFALFLLNDNLVAQCEQITSSPIPLFWAANTELNIDYYRVLRADSPSSVPVLLHTVFHGPDPISSFDPNPLSVGYYTVTAINTNGLESSPSNVLCVSMGVAPVTPSDFTVLADFSPIPTPLIISNLNRYQVAPNGIADGGLIYSDRSYVFSGTPVSLAGGAYLVTANGDKHSTSVSFLNFEVNRQSTVYVGHDDRILVKPDWLLLFTSTGEGVTVAGVNHSLFSRSFSQGTVSLGGNKLPTTLGSAFSMYTVIVK